jgi:hypothetical protein
LGWTDGRNVRIDLRWTGGDINRIRPLAQELVGLQPDIILTNGGSGRVARSRPDGYTIELGNSSTHMLNGALYSLSVQFPGKYEMVVNRKTATALGLAVPPSILLRADEVIE